MDWSGGEGTPLTHTVAGNTLITGSHWKALFGHDLKTGQKRWELSADGIRFRGGAAVLADDTLFVTAQKALVKLDGAPFKAFAAVRDTWAKETAYVYPGPIQYFGPTEVCDQPTKTLQYEQAK